MLIREMSKEQCFEFLESRSFGRLGCSREDQPYVVPVYFVCDGNYLYCFSTLGQKVEWMRTNPRVCIEVDEVVDHYHWKSLVVLGRYEELCNPSCPTSREHAREILGKRAMWWQPAYVVSEHRGPQSPLIPIFYRIWIDQVTGHEALPEAVEETRSETRDENYVKVLEH